MPIDTEAGAEAARKAIFAALVEAQDEGVTPAASRLKVALAFAVPVDLVAQIEAEGIEEEWPPL